MTYKEFVTKWTKQKSKFKQNALNQLLLRKSTDKNISTEIDYIFKLNYSLVIIINQILEDLSKMDELKGE